jgi:hypothetical protein
VYREATSFDELVAIALGEHEEELRQIVRLIINRELRRLTRELVDQELRAELELRANGGPPEPIEAELVTPLGVIANEAQARELAEQPPPATKVCRVCGDRKPLDAFPDPEHRSTCRRCENERAKQRRRERRSARAVDDESHPAARRWALPGKGLGSPASKIDLDVGERAREQVEAAQRNGVTTELVDGRAFTVLHLPPVAREPASTRVPVMRHAPARALGLGR